MTVSIRCGIFTAEAKKQDTSTDRFELDLWLIVAVVWLNWVNDQTDVRSVWSLSLSLSMWWVRGAWTSTMAMLCRIKFIFGVSSTPYRSSVSRFFFSPEAVHTERSRSPLSCKRRPACILSTRLQPRLLDNSLSTLHRQISVFRFTSLGARFWKTQFLMGGKHCFIVDCRPKSRIKAHLA